MATVVVEGIQVPQIELSPNVKKGLSVAGQASALTVKSVSDRTQAGELGRDGRGSRRWRQNRASRSATRSIPSMN